MTTILQGDSLDLIQGWDRAIDLVVTDPPYAFGGSGDEHALSATVAVVLREAAQRLRPGGWMLVMAASSARSVQYMIEAVRGIVTPVRLASWIKPAARTKVRTPGWSWATVTVVAFRKGKAGHDRAPSDELDWIMREPVTRGRRAELPPDVADWMVRPFALPGGLLVDPFAGSGAILAAGERHGMEAVGFEKNPPAAPVEPHQLECDLGDDCTCKPAPASGEEKP